MARKTSYGIVGHGAIGSAIGQSLSRQGHSLLFWDQRPRLRTTNRLEEFTGNSTVIIICAPSWVNRAVSQQLAPYLHSNQLILTVAKGVESGFVGMDKLLAEEVGDKANYGVLDGPMLAAELQKGLKAYGVMATKHPEERVLRDLANSGLYVQATNDITSVALCAVLKNIYALGFGLHDGLRLGANSKGALMVLTMSEMKTILRNLKANPEFVMGNAGLGDLLATGWSELSFNHRIGRALARGKKIDKLNSEGVNALRQIPLVIKTKQYPVLHILRQIFSHKVPVSDLSEVIAIA